MVFDHEMEDAVQAGLAEGSVPVRSARRYRGLSKVRLAEVCNLSLGRMEAIEAGGHLTQAEIKLISQALNFPPDILHRSLD